MSTHADSRNRARTRRADGSNDERPRQRYDDDRHRRHWQDRDEWDGDRYTRSSSRRSDDWYERRQEFAESSSSRIAKEGMTQKSPRDGYTRRDGARSHSSRRRSRSPRSSSFAQDRRREREAYDRQYGIGVSTSPNENQEAQDKEPSLDPDFGASGLLAKESNSKNGVTLKYFEPPEARKPKRKWRLYVFKDGKEVDLMHVSRQSCYLIGRDQTVVDIPVDHSSISKQHAVLQFRSMTERNEFGDEKRTTKPFLIDLESANGCSVNGRDIPSSRYYELRNGDTIRLGGSLREYVLLAEE